MIRGFRREFFGQEVSSFNIDGTVVFSGYVRAEDKREARTIFLEYLDRRGIDYVSAPGVDVVIEDMGFGEWKCEFVIPASAIKFK